MTDFRPINEADVIPIETAPVVLRPINEGIVIPLQPAETAQDVPAIPTPGQVTNLDAIRPEEPEETVFDRIGQDLETRGQEFEQIVADEDQTRAESAFQILGKTLLGSGLDIAGEVGSATLDAVGSGVSAVTPDFLEQPIVEGSEAALEWVMGSEVGQLGIEAARAGAEAYAEFKQEHPRAARNIESVLNVGLVAAPAASAARVGSKVPRFSRRALADAPDSEELFRKATDKFKATRQAGGALDPDDFADFMANFETAFTKQIDPALHPRLTGTLNLLEKRLGDDLDIEDLMLIRRNIGDVGGSLSPDERRLGRNLLEGFDRFVEGMPGDAEWRAARKLYSQGIKTDLIETAILNANKVASGLENGLRVEFRKLISNPARKRRFSKTEQEAIERVIEGDFTTNNLRKVGAFGGGEGLRRTPLTTLGGVAAGGAAGGPLGAVAAPLVGNVSQGLATNRTLRAANIAKALTAGARPEVPGRFGPTATRGAAALAISEAANEDEE